MSFKTINKGFIEENGRCTDIDECGQSVDNCHVDAMCFNTPGSFTCSCLPGYYGDGLSCKPKNPCEGHSCLHHEQCVVDSSNEPKCVCEIGYDRDSAGFCQDIDECQTHTCQIDEICTNTHGSFICSCAKGKL